MTQGSLPNPQILVVDDDPFITSLLQHSLQAEGYEVRIAHDGREALDSVNRSPPDLILLDLDIPYYSGNEVCERLKRDPKTRLIPVVIVTAQDARENKVHAWELGADEFLTKPFQLVEVMARCRSLLRIRRLIEERDSAEAVLFALVRTVEAKSPYTHGHSERVMKYANALAIAVGVDATQREILCKGALLHDIGKISIPDAILNKPSSLTEEEYRVIKQHPIQGAHIVEPLLSMRETIPIIRWHHERLDGTGYPDGLMGDQIPLLVRIISIADVFDSLTSSRPYRGATPAEVGLQFLNTSAEKGGLDPALVKVFGDLLNEDPSLMEPVHEAADMAGL